jgi:hypothetical protein
MIVGAALDAQAAKRVLECLLGLPLDAAERLEIRWGHCLGLVKHGTVIPIHGEKTWCRDAGLLDDRDEIGQNRKLLDDKTIIELSALQHKHFGGDRGADALEREEGSIHRPIRPGLCGGCGHRLTNGLSRLGARCSLGLSSGLPLDVVIKAQKIGIEVSDEWREVCRH